MSRTTSPKAGPPEQSPGTFGTSVGWNWGSAPSLLSPMGRDYANEIVQWKAANWVLIAFKAACLAAANAGA